MPPFRPRQRSTPGQKGLSRDVGKYGITVNSIPPGRIMSEQIRRNYPEEYRKSHAAAEIPAGDYGEPEDLAVLAVFQASPLALQAGLPGSDPPVIRRIGAPGPSAMRLHNGSV